MAYVERAAKQRRSGESTHRMRQLYSVKLLGAPMTPERVTLRSVLLWEYHMDIQSLAHEFVTMCNQGRNFDVMETMYAEDIVSVESNRAETHGKSAVIQKSRDWAAALEIHGERVGGPYFHGNDQFAVTFSFDITKKLTGQKTTQNEVGVYTVRDGKIVREAFYNAGNW